MSIKWNIDLVRAYFKSRGYELLSTEYINVLEKLTFKDQEGYFYTQSLNGFIRVVSPLKFHPSNIYIIENMKHWIKINNKKYVLLTDKFTGANNNMEFLCKTCNHVFSYSWSNVYCAGWGCPYCSNRRIDPTVNSLAAKYPELIKEFHSTKNGILTSHSIAPNYGKKVWWICDKGHEWTATPTHRLENKNCPYCSSSKGEKRIRQYLENNNIKFIHRYTFSDLVGIRNRHYHFDFYVKDFNLCIEFQGEQHYKPVDFAGKGQEWAEQQFKANLKRDKIKRKYCNQNDIQLLEIPYWDFDNIESILTTKLLLQIEDVS